MGKSTAATGVAVLFLAGTDMEMSTRIHIDISYLPCHIAIPYLFFFFFKENSVCDFIDHLAFLLFNSILEG